MQEGLRHTIEIGGVENIAFDDFSAVDDDLCAFNGFRLEFRVYAVGDSGTVPPVAGRDSKPFARGEREAADAGDAGQGFAAKPHRDNCRQVLGLLNFARRVAFQTEQRVVPAHAGAVVGHPDEAASAGLDFDGDARGLGVERVFNEFLHDTGRALDHLAGGDLIGDLLGEQADAVHAK